MPADDPAALAEALAALRAAPPSDAERAALREHIESSRRLSTVTSRYRSALSAEAKRRRN